MLDDDGFDDKPIPIAVAVSIRDEDVEVDFEGSAPQCEGSVNAVYAITVSATAYVFRCLLGLDIPGNSGCMAPVHVRAPEGSVVNARFPAAVAAGNVETSQRIVDVLLGALAQACPDRVPAASQGTMNNFTIGGWDSEKQRPFAYYETLGGGMGAGSACPGASGIHSHMTNTMNTPVEALEYAYPFRISRYVLREGDGRRGKPRGGRRGHARNRIPARRAGDDRLRSTGIAAVRVGRGRGRAIRPKRVDSQGQGKRSSLEKTELAVKKGDRLRIETPGGGGYGKSRK